MLVRFTQIYHGINISPEKAMAYRRKWAREAGMTLEEAYRRNPWDGPPPPGVEPAGHVNLNGPSLITKAANFAKATVQHVKAGRPKAGSKDKLHRLEFPTNGGRWEKNM